MPLFDNVSVRLSVYSLHASVSHMGREPENSQRETQKRGRIAVYSTQTKTVFSETTDGDVEPDDAAVEVLCGDDTEETADATEAAPWRASRHGRTSISPGAVAQANERHQDREERSRR